MAARCVLMLAIYICIHVQTRVIIPLAGKSSHLDLPMHGHVSHPLGGNAKRMRAQSTACVSACVAMPCFVVYAIWLGLTHLALLGLIVLFVV